MSDFIQLATSPREQVGKTSRKLDQEGLIPAVIYGYGVDATPISVDRHDFELLMHREVLSSAVLKVQLDGDEQNVIVKDVQYHPVSDRILHVDFLSVDLAKKIHTTTHVEVVGFAPGTEEGGTVTQSLQEIEIKALPTNIPESIQANVDGMGIGDALHVSDLEAPEDVEILTDPEWVVVSVTLPQQELPEEGEELEEEELEPG
jgi:large subunit ribosomal protein L25